MSFLDRLFLPPLPIVTPPAAPTELRVVTYTGFSSGAPFVTWDVGELDDLAAADVVCIDTTVVAGTAFLKLGGMDTVGLMQPRKLLVNVGPTVISILHQANATESRFLLTAADYDLRPRGAVEALWLPEDGIRLAGWRLVGTSFQ